MLYIFTFSYSIVTGNQHQNGLYEIFPYVYDGWRSTPKWLIPNISVYIYIYVNILEFTKNGDTTKWLIPNIDC